MRTFNRALATGLIVAATYGLAAGPLYAQSATGNGNSGSAAGGSSTAAPSNAAPSGGTSNNGASNNGMPATPKTDNQPANGAQNGAQNNQDQTNPSNGAEATPATPPNAPGMSNTSNDQSTTPGANNNQSPKKHAAASMSRHRVEEVQTALSNSGSPIAIDGDWGPKTVAALKDFQKAHNLKASGKLDKETRQALDLGAHKT